MARIGSHHWHILVDAENHPTASVVEHEHTVNRGRRHAHYHDYESILRFALDQGQPLGEARIAALRLDGTASTTLDFRRPPRPSPMNEEAIRASLHPEVRRSLS